MLILKIIEHPVFGVLFGALVTVLVTRWYYVRAAVELREESERLLKATNLILAFLENKDATVTVKRDAEGMPTGIIVAVGAHVKGTSAAVWHAEAVKRDS